MQDLLEIGKRRVKEARRMAGTKIFQCRMLLEAEVEFLFYHIVSSRYIENRHYKGVTDISKN